MQRCRNDANFVTPDDFNDPFTSHYSFFKDTDAQIDPLRTALMKHLPSRLTFSQEERSQRREEYQEGKPPNELSKFVDRVVRFIVALIGGSFLVAPMIIMTLQASQKKSLITVSVAVLLFALSLSFGVRVSNYLVFWVYSYYYNKEHITRVSNVETLVSTATYAAVLVVFVGTSSGNTS
ncbi:hypothetical protein NM208_g2750 [Fusarium decemcellulare]|uniref:Uncharacterized protein n=1 Tax=Fusarium decemcellulare TaxID=57161 RepID=A0ACC1SRL0_9HYPO|nr:hypothetical protein NM208_g2750 [Fusarium decemcellulare]